MLAVADCVKVPPQVEENPMVIPTEKMLGGPGAASKVVIALAPTGIGGRGTLPDALPKVTAPVLGTVVELNRKKQPDAEPVEATKL